jgi:hypothetical protein
MTLMYKFCLLTSAVLSFTTKPFAQTCFPTATRATLDINGVKSDVLNTGVLWEGVYQVPKAVFPQTVSPSSLSSCGLMVAGKNAAGSLKIAAQLALGAGGSDFFPGPLDSTGNVSRNTCNNFDKLFGISISDINDFRTNGGRVISDAMKTWPAKGNPYFRAINGFDLPNQNLAPFVDANRDGIYNPENGDYPDFCGDYAYWWIFNDKGNAHTSSKGGTPMGIEVKGMAYAFSRTPSDSALFYSTIYNYEINYKGTETLDSAYIALWIDPDLGCNEDDYFGCSPSNNLAYAYNAKARDGGLNICEDSNKKSYGNNIPIIGIKLLQTPKDANGQELGMTNFMYHYTQTGTYPAKAGWATLPTEFYNYMTSRWRDGSPLTSGGEGTSTTNAATKFAYPDNPTSTTGWNMPNSTANTLEKAMIMSCGPFKMLPNSRHRIAFATVSDLVVAGHPRVDITKLISRANSLKNVCTFPTAVKDVPEQNSIINIVPNPVLNEANLIYSGFINRVSIFNLTGQLMSENKDINSNAFRFSTQTMNAGIYVYRMIDNNGKNITGRFTVVK